MTTPPISLPFDPAHGCWTVHFRTDWAPRLPMSIRTLKKLETIKRMWRELDEVTSLATAKKMRRKLRALCEFIIKAVFRASDSETLEWLGKMCRDRADYLPLNGASIILQDEMDVVTLSWIAEHAYREEDRPTLRRILEQEYGMVRA